MKRTPAARPDRRSQFVRVGVLLAILAGLLWYRFGPAERATPASNSEPAMSTPAASSILPEPVALETLEEVAELGSAGRNPFAFGVRPAPPPARIATPPPVALPPPVPPAPAWPPPIALRLVGVTTATPSGRTMVTLKDAQGTGVYQAFEGDVVEGRYRVVKIGRESVVVSYVDGSGARTLPLGG
jgi:hypothetical protein